MPPDSLQANRRMARYLAVWAASLAMMIGAVVALCVLADPYAIIGTPGIPGLTARKPEAYDWVWVGKPYMVQRQHPVTLIVGNSTADVGFNPRSPSWPGASKPVFNLALDGSLPSTHLRYLQHAFAAASPTHVVISINFTESLLGQQAKVSAATSGRSGNEARLLVLPDGTPNPGYARARIADLVFSTLSFTALADSVSTLFSQNDNGQTYETADGWNDGGRFRRWAREDGFYELAMNKDREKVREFTYWRDSSRKVDIGPVFDMIRLAHARGADVTVVIVPNHTDEMETLRQLGLDADYDAWKTSIVEGVAKAAPRGDVAVWDFSGFSRYTTEPIPAPGDRVHRLRWFWEPVHFQADLGDLMIARMSGSPAPADLGVRLTPANLRVQLADYHVAERAWVAAHPADVARIAEMVREVR